MMRIKENTGTEIEAIGKTAAIVGYIVSIVVGLFIILAGSDSRSDEIETVTFFGGVLTAGVGCFLTWLSTRVIIGFGELVEYTAEAASYLEVIANGQDRKGENSTETSRSRYAPKNGRAQLSNVDDTLSKAGDWYCSQCDYRNSAASITCKNCGKPNPYYSGNYSPKNQTYTSAAKARVEKKIKADTAICPQCGKEQTSDNRFCQYCGSKIE